MKTRDGFNLEERTGRFGISIIRFCSELPKNIISEPLIKQLVRAATSVGANYCEADDAVSKKDFRNKIGICKKEARESKHFLRMIMAAVPDHSSYARPLYKEADELNLIFNSIYAKTK